MSPASQRRQESPKSKVPETKVTISIHVMGAGGAGPELLILERIHMKLCNVDWTWNQLFQKEAGLHVDPEKYVVTATKKLPVLVDNKIRDLIGQYNKIRKFYSIKVIKRRSDMVLYKGHTAAASPYKNASTSNGRSQPNTQKVVPPKRSHPHPDDHLGNINKGQKRKAEAPLNLGQQSQQQRATGNNLRNPFNPPLGRPRTAYEEDNFDAASQCTNASQDSQEQDLAELGIANDDIKPRVLNRLINDISNPEMLCIREELRQIMRSGIGKWNRYASKAPRTGHFLMAVFNISMSPD